MTDNTSIEWADATVNAINGCDPISPGCTNCYAMRSGGRNLPNYPSTGLTKPSKAGHVWTGEVRLNEAQLMQPLKWRRPRRIFWNAHGDMFHENVPDEWIDRCFAVMAMTPQHIHMVLTKRAGRMRRYIIGLNDVACDRLSHAAGDLGFDDDVMCNIANWVNGFSRWNFVADDGNPLDGSVRRWPLPNVWLGVSVEDQQRADERIPDLLATPAAKRFVSCEPMLGPVDLNHIKMFDYVTDEGGRATGWESALNGKRMDEWDEETGESDGHPKLDWVIVGGESGKPARPMHPDWARSIRDQCAAAGVAIHFKQWGAWAPAHAIEIDHLPQDKDTMMRVGKKRAGRTLDGVTHDGVPV